MALRLFLSRVLDALRKKAPDLVKGTTPDQVLNAKKSVEQAIEALKRRGEDRTAEEGEIELKEPPMIDEDAHLVEPSAAEIATYTPPPMEAGADERIHKLVEEMQLFELKVKGAPEPDTLERAADSMWWRWAIVGCLVIVVVGGCAYYFWIRRRRGDADGGGGDPGDGQDGAGALDPAHVAPPSPSTSPSARSPTPSPAEARRVLVAHRLPHRAESNPDAPHGFRFDLDPDVLPLQLSRGLPPPVVVVGVLPSSAASEELAADLLERFACSPVFLTRGLHKDVSDGFGEHYLWPVLHCLLPLASSSGGINQELYRAVPSANTQFADRVFERLNPDEDLVFIHGDHLWAPHTILRHKSPRARVGFSLHSPFPAS